jgi:hypothetical protein
MGDLFNTELGKCPGVVKSRSAKYITDGRDDLRDLVIDGVIS